MSRSEKKQRALERAERTRQREMQNGYTEDTSQPTLQSKATTKTKKPASALQIFFKTFVIAFAVLTAISLGATSVYTKFMNFNPFEKEDQYTPIIVDEMDNDREELASLVDENSPLYNQIKDADRANVLLLGVNGNLTDTIMLVSFDRENKKVDVISIPRDTYYHREGYNGLAEKKLNAAYKGNPVNTAKAVSKILCGIPINYYAVIKYEGVENIVDSMGGVPVNIPFNMKYDDPYDKPPLHINLKKGEQVLDGKHAVQFLRYRHGYTEGDMGRVKAQQEFMKSAFRQCLSFKLPTVTKTVFENVDSDITIGTALSLAKGAAGISSDSITTYTMPNTLDPDPPFYVYPDADGIEEMIIQIYSGKTSEEQTTDGAVSQEQ
ncbi:LCP family protein [Clostridium aminobutyricum]|uniref:LCP family protein n=1 Tax=Clostridium aminobutyricum TaxID=33953 RepID=A0A939IJX1_CLOAM|nr:LCP family protein [Clostridium aminobutyricum]MBN7774028.1 LCP family protein [Clostridium aminobutyricum]